METLFERVRSYILIVIGLLITAFGTAGFLIPAKITGGGVTGVATLIFYSTKIPVGLSFFAINLLLISVSLKVLSLKFAFKTVLAMFGLSVFFGLFQYLVPQPIIKDNFLATVIGASLAGTGIGICIAEGGSTGGTDIIAMMINKYRNISPARVILYIDIVIILSSYLVFRDVEKIVYGFVSMAICTYSIDLIIEGSKQSLQVFIFTDKHEEMAKELSENIGRGITMIDGKGWYTQERKEVLLMVIKKQELHDTLRIVKHVDHSSFISVNSVMGVYGRGFEKIRY
ncbi:MAG: YitT family protein [Ignavibacteria bacterium]|nr:YitT family protein [Ignavibacteria bacterium]